MTIQYIEAEQLPQISKDFWAKYVQKLWFLGDPSLLRLPLVSIIVTRDISPYGRARTKKLTGALVAEGFCILSGLAAGVDTEAHETALQGGGKTIAAMGTPIDDCYPKENEWLKAQIAEKGLVLSQFSPGGKVYRSNFPRRNELMARLSDVTFVVEAHIDSGTRHQVKAAVEMGKRVAFRVFTRRSEFPLGRRNCPERQRCRDQTT